jgi:hypothetical protein
MHGRARGRLLQGGQAAVLFSVVAEDSSRSDTRSQSSWWATYAHRPYLCAGGATCLFLAASIALQTSPERSRASGNAPTLT